MPEKKKLANARIIWTFLAPPSVTSRDGSRSFGRQTAGPMLAVRVSRKDGLISSHFIESQWEDEWIGQYSVTYAALHVIGLYWRGEMTLAGMIGTARLWDGHQSWMSTRTEVKCELRKKTKTCRVIFNCHRINWAWNIGLWVYTVSLVKWYEWHTTKVLQYNDGLGYLPSSLVLCMFYRALYKMRDTLQWKPSIIAVYLLQYKTYQVVNEEVHICINVRILLEKRCSHSVFVEPAFISGVMLVELCSRKQVLWIVWAGFCVLAVPCVTETTLSMQWRQLKSLTYLLKPRKIHWTTVNIPGVTTPPQFSIAKWYVNSEFPVAIGAPPTVQLTVTNDSLMMVK